MAQKQRTWVVAADKASAHIFARDEGRLKSISDLYADDSAIIDMGNKFTGRTGSSPTERHKYEPSMAQSHQREMALAHQVAILINDAAARQAFDALIIVATPQMLGYLRDGLDDQARLRVTAEVGKEFAQLPFPELQERLMGILHNPDIMSQHLPR
jgi:protein required for attachment to host cells